ncbi:hypothetical protein CEXT_494461 [Caerostris extrusa]|uniref:Uncharacterized protein n=1 Tax=Caerostris extrusa TaxID=172846 RepID=A0AAV4RMP0_CAEEX|nr:hypothetical protein CEXT_494461 [Caerostris extrusa]
MQIGLAKSHRKIFLMNGQNKSPLIEPLKTDFEKFDIGDKKAQEDANFAISKANKLHNVAIVGKDIDRLVLMIGLSQSLKD